MPSMLTGVVDDNVITQIQRVIDMEPVIAQLETDETPLTTLLQRLANNSRDAYSQIVQWLEDELHPRYAKAASTFLVGATSITMTSPQGLYYKPFDIIHDEQTGEKMQVTASTATTLTVVRGVAGTTAAASSGAADGLVRVANVSMEGDTIATLKQTAKVAQFNYEQITRTPFGFTNTLKASKLYGQADVMGYEANKKLIEHKREWENTFWVGNRYLDTTGTHPRGYCGGITSYIATNVQTTATLTQALFESFLMTVSRYGSNNKIMICAPIILSAIAFWPAGRLAPPDPDTLTSYGVAIRNYRAANGFAIDLVEHRDWMDFTAGTFSMGGSGFILDMDNIKRRTLRSTRLLTGRAGNDEDSDKQEYLTEDSIAVMQERTHGWLRGVTAFS